MRLVTFKENSSGLIGAGYVSVCQNYVVVMAEGEEAKFCILRMVEEGHTWDDGSANLRKVPLENVKLLAPYLS